MGSYVSRANVIEGEKFCFQEHLSLVDSPIFFKKSYYDLSKIHSNVMFVYFPIFFFNPDCISIVLFTFSEELEYTRC